MSCKGCWMTQYNTTFSTHVKDLINDFMLYNVHVFLYIPQLNSEFLTGKALNT